MTFSKKNIDGLAALIRASGFLGLTCFIQGGGASGPEDEARRLAALADSPDAFLSLIEQDQSPAAAGLVSLLDWDTGFFGFPCAAVEALYAAGRGPSRYEALGRVVSELVAWCRQREVGFIVAKVPGPDPLVCQALEAAGFYLTDTGVTLARVPGPISETKEVTPELTWAQQAGDPAEIARIFNSLFFDGRFYHDPRIPEETADRLWETAIYNQVRGEADRILFLLSAGRPIGLASIKDTDAGPDRTEKVGRLFIFGLLPSHRGRGLGKPLLAELLRRIQDQYQRLEVGTSTYNLPALRVYQFLGFVLQGFHASLHCWL